MKIRHKLFLLLGGSAVLAGLAFGVGTVPLVRAAARGPQLERLRSEADLLAAVLAAHPPAVPDAAQAWAEEWARRLGLRVTLLGVSGNVIAESSLGAGALALVENHAGRPELDEAARTGTGEAERRSSTTSETYHYFARRIEDAAPVAFLRVAVLASRLESAKDPYVALLAGVMAGTALLLTVLAYVAVRRWSRPLEQLSAGAARIAAGDLAPPLPAGRDDEVGALARALESMRRELAARMAETEGERRFLGSVISGMKEGLLIVDAQRRVRIANEAFQRTWGVRVEPRGRLLVEVLRHPQVLAAVDAVLARGMEVRERVPDTGTGRAFEMHAAPQQGDDEPRPAGAVVLFFDITRLEALESLRKEFVANVSHELRTPLTSIKGAVLTLLDAQGAPPDVTGRFLETIRRNTERMAALVEDLTDLSLIETGAIKLDIRSLDAGALVREIVAQVAPRYAALDVQVELDVPPAFTVRADRRRLEQILVNLVDNAFKFNRRGGTVRVCAARQDGDRTTLTVEDTGAGIPSDQLDKVFHRFHRVDPARAHEFGGTGLGLAIVKHLVQLHGGTVRVESELGRGSRFSIEW